jgi:AmpD protein
VSAIVLHCISLPPGEYGSDAITSLFTNTLDPDQHPYFSGIHGLRVSAHLLIRRDGHCIQYVSFDQRAWHAGVSVLHGVERCNDFSIGIELEGTEYDPYTDAQYQQLAIIIADLMQAYPAIQPSRIVAHSSIAPGRKTDPGPSLDWARLYRALA